MDKARIGYARRKRIRRIVLGPVAGAAFLAVAWVVSRIEPAIQFPKPVRRSARLSKNVPDRTESKAGIRAL